MNLNFKSVRRESLPTPAPSLCTWEEYISSPAGQHPVLAREIVCKNTTKVLKATVAMVCILFVYFLSNVYNFCR